MMRFLYFYICVKWKLQPGALCKRVRQQSLAWNCAPPSDADLSGIASALSGLHVTKVQEGYHSRNGHLAGAGVRLVLWLVQRMTADGA